MPPEQRLASWKKLAPFHPMISGVSGGGSCREGVVVTQINRGMLFIIGGSFVYGYDAKTWRVAGERRPQ